MVATPRLTRRGAIFYYRMAVPKRLVARVGRAELKTSLHTKDRLQAKLLCRTLSNAIDRLFEVLPQMHEVSQAEIEERIRTYFQACLNKSAELAIDLPDDPEIDLDFEVAGLHENVERVRQDLKHAKFSQAVTADALRILNPSNLTGTNVDLDTLKQAQVMIMRAHIENYRILAAKLSGDYSKTAPQDPLFAGMAATGLPSIGGESLAATAPKRTFAEVAESYMAFKSPSWEAKTIQAVQRALNNAMQVIGADRQVKLIATTDIARFRDILTKIPPNYSKLKKFDGMTLLEVAEKNDTGMTLSAKSQKKDFEFVQSFMRWATDEGHIDKQPGAHIKVIPAKNGPIAKGRFPYDKAQLAAIFNSPIFKGCKSAERRSAPGDQIIRDGKYWVPIVAIYSGLRLGEIVQLLGKDIKQEDGIHYFDVCKEEGEEKKIKSSSSYRRVPVHRRLIELGFLVHAAHTHPDKRLFEDIAMGHDSSFSHNFSKFWGRYVIQIGAKTTKTTFHSFRHNFKDALVHSGVPEAISMALCGHSDGSVHSNYGSGQSLKMLKEATDKVVFEQTP